MYSFDDFWEDYDKKVGRDKCEPKWYLLAPEEHERIRIHVPGFVVRNRNKQYRPNPLSYLNGRMWLDEKIGEKEEETRLYIEPKETTVSQDPSKYFDPEEGKRFIIGKIKQAYEGKTYLNDVGEVYTKRLEPFLDTPFFEMASIKAVAHERYTRKPKNRFEELPEVNYELEVRNGVLRYNIDKWKEEKREIYLEL